MWKIIWKYIAKIFFNKKQLLCTKGFTYPEDWTNCSEGLFILMRSSKILASGGPFVSELIIAKARFDVHVDFICNEEDIPTIYPQNRFMCVTDFLNFNPMYALLEHPDEEKSAYFNWTKQIQGCCLHFYA